MPNRFQRWILRLTGAQQELDILRRHTTLMTRDYQRMAEEIRVQRKTLRSVMEAGAKLEGRIPYQMVEPHRPA